MNPTTDLPERYAIGEQIGRGGVADVYHAEDQVLGRQVADKVLRDASTDPTDRDRFVAEARTLAGLSHPGLVTVLDAGTEGDRPYLVMELVPGRTLAECCQRQALEPRYVASMGARLADALAYVHSLGIVHRDVKPANVLLHEDGRVLLTDFGIARLTDQAVGLTSAGFIMGTVAYKSPEQVRREAIGPATDVYSLGLVLLEALTGERAYPGPSAEAAVARLVSPPRIPDELPAQWRSVLRRMTEIEPADRPHLVEVRAVLEQLAADAKADPPTAGLRSAEFRWDELQPTGPRQDQPVTELVNVYPATAESAIERLAHRVAEAAAGVTARARTRWAGLSPSGQRLGVVLGLLAAMLLVLTVALFASSGSQRGDSGGTEPAGPAGEIVDIPPNVPAQLRAELEDLHRAVNG